MMVLSHAGLRGHSLAQGDVLVIVMITIFPPLIIVAVLVATTFILAVAAIATAAIAILLILAVAGGQIFKIGNFEFPLLTPAAAFFFFVVIIVVAATVVIVPSEVDKDAGFIIVEEQQ